MGELLSRQLLAKECLITHDDDGDDDGEGVDDGAEYDGVNDDYVDDDAEDDDEEDDGHLKKKVSTGIFSMV